MIDPYPAAVGKAALLTFARSMDSVVVESVLGFVGSTLTRAHVGTLQCYVNMIHVVARTTTAVPHRAPVLRRSLRITHPVPHTLLPDYVLDIELVRVLHEELRDNVAKTHTYFAQRTTAGHHHVNRPTR